MLKTGVHRLKQASKQIRIRVRLVKPDHPRAIDRYIDYFGDSNRRAAARDVCGERLLETLAGQDRVSA
jgi:hypothetical protein